MVKHANAHSIMTSSMIRESVGITSPITHMGRVVYNARRDFLETRRRKTKRGAVPVYDDDDFGDPECHTIQPYELCFRSRTNRYKNYTPNDTDLSVFSNANGILISTKTNRTVVAALPQGSSKQQKQEARIAAMLSELEFAGVACNRAIYDENNNANEEMLAVQVGGLQPVEMLQNTISDRTRCTTAARRRLIPALCSAIPSQDDL